MIYNVLQRAACTGDNISKMTDDRQYKTQQVPILVCEVYTFRTCLHTISTDHPIRFLVSSRRAKGALQAGHQQHVVAVGRTQRVPVAGTLVAGNRLRIAGHRGTQ